ncbi:MAG: cell division protein FtsZ, partial [Candidatus Roizmanbacteria bacterium]
KEKVDTLIIIPNQKVLEIIDPKAGMLDAFKKVDSILHQGVKGISELITTSGLINVDFADVRSVMANAGTALMGIGIGTGENRTTMAIKEAISSPLLETSMEGAKGVLFNIVGGPDMSMSEVNEAASIITKAADPDADIIFGAVIDKDMVDQVKITVIATKFDERRLRLGQAMPQMRPAIQQQFTNQAFDPSGTNQSSQASPQTPVRHEMSLDSDDSPVISSTSIDDDEFDIPTFLRKKS